MARRHQRLRLIASIEASRADTIAGRAVLALIAAEEQRLERLDRRRSDLVASSEGDRRRRAALAASLTTTHARTTTKETP